MKSSTRFAVSITTIVLLIIAHAATAAIEGAQGGAVYVMSNKAKGNSVCVNQLGIPNISGFTVSASGQLQAIPNSTRDLAGGPLALPAQVSFTPDGAQLLVTEKGTNLIDIFQVQPDGSTTGPIAQSSSGKTPFGFAFGPSGAV